MEVGGGCGSGGGAGSGTTGWSAAAAADAKLWSQFAKPRLGRATSRQCHVCVIQFIGPCISHLGSHIHLWRAHAFRPFHPGICLPPRIHEPPALIAASHAFSPRTRYCEYHSQLLLQLQGRRSVSTGYGIDAGPGFHVFKSAESTAAAVFDADANAGTTTTAIHAMERTASGIVTFLRSHGRFEYFSDATAAATSNAKYCVLLPAAATACPRATGCIHGEQLILCYGHAHGTAAEPPPTTTTTATSRSLPIPAAIPSTSTAPAIPTTNVSRP
mmetsp:Transcript_2708/g.5823  ORF Transcript_2708/g.5823 Transcript_2708/m.5823 type:complete len:272 (-) Transcript_2708:376-1191(-)